MIALQLSANTGPAECCLGVQLALRRLLQEAATSGVRVDMLDQEAGPVGGTLRSVLLRLDGTDALSLAQRWCGSILWVSESPYRPRHQRKNWFLHGALFHCDQSSPADGEIRYEATRASGPGGQHVNKTDSAIRATHVATGLSVKVQSQRSQHANKRLAAQLLSIKLAEQAEAEQERVRQARHRQHRLAERGGAGRVFVGRHFTERLAP